MKMLLKLDLNLGPPDCESDTLTTRPRCKYFNTPRLKMPWEGDVRGISNKRLFHHLIDEKGNDFLRLSVQT